VISVGNLTVGGTGKTPVAAWVARTLADEGARPAVVSRGYGQDELALHKRWNPDVLVRAHPDRVLAVRSAARDGATVAVLDDGFQHRRLARTLDIVLLAAEEPLPGRLLPRGPFREPLGALSRADVVLITRKVAGEESARRVEAIAQAAAPEARVARMRLEPGGWSDGAGADVDPPGGPLLAVASVAHPEGFARLVESLTGSQPELMPFPDHHPYDRKDVRAIRERAGGRTVVVTEKDAVKLEGLRESLPELRVLRLRVRLEAGAEALLERVTQVGREGARP
jgi:tetraacyldisaccharide 4'-kinase